jgi:hypothetical protein
MEDISSIHTYRASSSQTSAATWRPDQRVEKMAVLRLMLNPNVIRAEMVIWSTR